MTCDGATVQFASDTEHLWRQRFELVRIAWKKIEWLSAAEGVRSVCMVSIPRAQLSEAAAHYASRGLTVAPLRPHAIATGYASKLAPPKDGHPFAYRVAIGRPAAVDAFRVAYTSNNHIQIGELLGYPRCCCEFFQRAWIVADVDDVTWHAARNSEFCSSDGRHVDVKAHPLSNLLARWLGLRAVPHLPCSFTCAKTVTFADNLFELGVRSGHAQELGWLRSILALEYTWSSASGMTEITTSLFRIRVPTKYCGARLQVRTHAP